MLGLIAPMKRIIFPASVLLAFCGTISIYGASRECVQPGQGYFRIHVGVAGLLGGFAHEHLIEARTLQGCASIEESALNRSSIQLVFKTADIQVVDPKESDKDRAEVQKTMQTEVLRVSDYPRITFESTAVESGSTPSELRVRGNLTIRGKTVPVTVPLSFSNAADGTHRATGKFSFKQTTFGIKPIQLAAGTIKVKDELQAEFELFFK